MYTLQYWNVRQFWGSTRGVPIAKHWFPSPATRSPAPRVKVNLACHAAAHRRCSGSLHASFGRSALGTSERLLAEFEGRSKAALLPLSLSSQTKQCLSRHYSRQSFDGLIPSFPGVERRLGCRRLPSPQKTLIARGMEKGRRPSMLAC